MGKDNFVKYLEKRTFKELTFAQINIFKSGIPILWESSLQINNKCLINNVKIILIKKIKKIKILFKKL